MFAEEQTDEVTSWCLETNAAFQTTRFPKFLISYEEKWNGTPLAVGSPTFIYPDLKREQLSDYSICKDKKSLQKNEAFRSD